MADLGELVHRRPVADRISDVVGAKATRCQAGRSHRVARAVREEDRALDRAGDLLVVHVFHRETGPTNRVRRVEANDVANKIERARVVGEELVANGLDRDEVAEVVKRHCLCHLAPRTEVDLAVEVATRHATVGAGSNRALGVLADEGDRDHAAHRRAVHKDAVEAKRVEEECALIGPLLDGVLLVRTIRPAVARRVEREQTKAALAEAVVDETEVVAAKQRATKLHHDRTVLWSSQFVIDPIFVRQRDEWHRSYSPW